MAGIEIDQDGLARLTRASASRASELQVAGDAVRAASEMNEGRHRIRALSAAAIALVVAVVLTACAGLGPARDPKHGELVGTWKNGSTVLTISDAVNFHVRHLSSEHVFSEEGRDIELDVTGTYSVDRTRLDRLRALTFSYTPVGGSTGGLIQAAFDPDTDPVSIVILGGSVDQPAYFRLTKQP